jgi:hypothetical protein
MSAMLRCASAQGRARGVDLGAPRRQKRHGGDNGAGVRLDQPAVHAVGDALGQRTDARGNHRQADARQLRQRVAECLCDRR